MEINQWANETDWLSLHKIATIILDIDGSLCHRLLHRLPDASVVLSLVVHEGEITPEL